MAAAADNGASADRNAEFDLIVARGYARAFVLRSMIQRRHARACRRHPRLNDPESAKTWMAGTSPAMTIELINDPAP
jgi:hypothetical protein